MKRRLDLTAIALVFFVAGCQKRDIPELGN